METASKNYDEALLAVAQSGVLGTSKRQYDLLKYLFDKTQDEQGDTIKAYAIALDVLGRSDDFDNSTDSIVRVEMYRLRKNLLVFNSTHNKFQIDIPAASYIPNIVCKPQSSKKSFWIFQLIFKHKIPIILFTIFFSLTSAFLTRTILGKRNSAPLETSFKASISFPDALNMASMSESPKLYNLFVRETQVAFLDHQFIEYQRHGVTDYKIELQISDLLQTGKNKISISIFVDDHELVWHKDYYIDALVYFNNANNIALNFRKDMISEHVEKIIIRHHATNPKLETNRCTLFQCYHDTLFYTVPQMVNFLGPQPLACLNPNLTNVFSDKHSIHVARADIYTGIMSGTFPFHINDLFEKAKNELTLAKKYKATSVYFSYINLRLETYRNQKILLPSTKY